MVSITGQRVEQARFTFIKGHISSSISKVIELVFYLQKIKVVFLQKKILVFSLQKVGRLPFTKKKVRSSSLSLFKCFGLHLNSNLNQFRVAGWVVEN